MNAIAMIRACGRQNPDIGPPPVPTFAEETLAPTGPAVVMFPSDAGRTDAYRTTQPSEVVPPGAEPDPQGDVAC